jgi:hypothetical protein
VTIPRNLRKLAANTELLDRFVAALPVGRAGAIKAEALCRLLELPYADGTTGRSRGNGAGLVIRNLTLVAIARGVPVLGDNAGYYTPQNRAEVERSIARHERAAQTKLERIAALRASVEELFAETSR